jgi:hypothetical protein
MKAPARDRHDPKALGTHEEKILLADYVNDMASMHMAQPREAVIVVFKELLAWELLEVRSSSESAAPLLHSTTLRNPSWPTNMCLA